MDFFRGMLLMLLGLSALALIDLWIAQEIVWGLSLFHVDSGIWGPLFLQSALFTVITGAIVIGSRYAK